MNIFFVEHGSNLMGGQKVLLEVISALSDKARLNLIVPYNSMLESELRGVNCRCGIYPYTAYRIANGRKGPFDFVKAIALSLSILSKWGRELCAADLVYINGARLLPIALPTLVCGKHVLVHAHTPINGLPGIFLGAIGRISSRVIIVFNSQYTHDSSSRLLYSARFRIVNNGLSKLFSKKQFRNRFQSAGLRCITFGTVCRNKGQHVVVKAARHFPEITFYIVGDPHKEELAYYNELRSSAPNNVLFSGYNNDIECFVEQNGINISIIPSIWEEPFGLVSIESMAMSLLTIVSGRGELVNIASRTEALTYEEEDELRDQIFVVESLSPRRRGALARKQHKRVISNYHADTFISEMMDSIMSSKTDAKSDEL